MARSANSRTCKNSVGCRGVSGWHQLELAITALDPKAKFLASLRNSESGRLHVTDWPPEQLLPGTKLPPPMAAITEANKGTLGSLVPAALFLACERGHDRFGCRQIAVAAAEEKRKKCTPAGNLMPAAVDAV
jgi:hypothetical protein